MSFEWPVVLKRKAADLQKQIPSRAKIPEAAANAAGHDGVA
jgi:hypothetical protein